MEARNVCKLAHGRSMSERERRHTFPREACGSTQHSSGPSCLSHETTVVKRFHDTMYDAQTNSKNLTPPPNSSKNDTLQHGVKRETCETLRLCVEVGTCWQLRALVGNRE